MYKTTCPECQAKIIIAGSIVLDAAPVWIYWLDKNDLRQTIATPETDVPHYQLHRCANAPLVGPTQEQPLKVPYKDRLRRPFDPANRKGKRRED